MTKLYSQIRITIQNTRGIIEVNALGVIEG